MWITPHLSFNRIFPKLVELKSGLFWHWLKNKLIIIITSQSTDDSTIHHHNFECTYLQPKLQHLNLRIPQETEQIASYRVSWME